MTKIESSLPVLFIGHGSPMNALANNSYSTTLNLLAQKIPRPRAILCVSAHWLTEDLKITAMTKPKTIHDFYGFPQELFAVEYPAPGSPQIAQEIQTECSDLDIKFDYDWGLDHGSWSVLKHLYPEADIPVLQLSIAIQKGSAFQFEVGQKMARLKNLGILIVGSGNVVHNLRQIQFAQQAAPLPWAEQFNQWIQTKLEHKDFTSLVLQARSTPEGALSIPTWEHWYPFLTILGAANKEIPAQIIYDGIENSSISMKSLLFS
ncbi:4,5-DOPA dioxygenase extradiol [bacterium]|nr:4,5-DOPA dioxygenase extradiol [bacterium]